LLVNPALLGGGFDHGVFTADVVGRHRQGGALLQALSISRCFITPWSFLACAQSVAKRRMLGRFNGLLG
jgi:hypothetical protein